MPTPRPSRTYADFLGLAEKSTKKHRFVPDSFYTIEAMMEVCDRVAWRKLAGVMQAGEVSRANYCAQYPDALLEVKTGDWAETAKKIEDGVIEVPSDFDEFDISDLPNEKEDDGHRLSRLFIRTKHKHEAGYGIRYWRQQWLVWDGVKYKATEGETLRCMLAAFIKLQFDIIWKAKKAAYEEWRKSDRYNEDEDKGEPFAQPVKQLVAADAFFALKTLVLYPDIIEQGTWVTSATKFEKKSFVSLKNGLLDLEDALKGGKAQLIPHSPKWFSEISLPYEYDPYAKYPKWQKFLDRSMGGDRDRIAILQEWAGYLLIPSADQQKFLMLEGEGRNGKSVYMAAMEAMLGRENCTHVGIELFGKDFAMESTINKLACIASECPTELDNVAEGVLKAFVGGDMMTINRKYMKALEVPPTARLILSANKRPRFSDTTGAIWRRILLVPWYVQIAESEQVKGMATIPWWEASGELPGIFNWAIEGLIRLRKNGKFTESAKSVAAVSEYQTEMNPARAFLLEHYRIARNEGGSVNETSRIHAHGIYGAYSDWVYANGYKALGAANFAKELFRVFPSVTRKRTAVRKLATDESEVVEKPWFFVGIEPIPVADHDHDGEIIEPALAAKIKKKKKEEQESLEFAGG